MAEKKSSGMGIVIIIVIIAVGVILWLMSRSTAEPPPNGNGPPATCPAGSTTYMHVIQSASYPDHVEEHFYDYQLGTVTSWLTLKTYFQTFMDQLLADGNIISIQYDCAQAQFEAINR